MGQVQQRDRAYFKKHPDADYYVRPITSVEILEQQKMGNPDANHLTEMLVGNTGDGLRIRIGMSKGIAYHIDEFREIQKGIRKALNQIDIEQHLRKASGLQVSPPTRGKNMGFRNFYGN